MSNAQNIMAYYARRGVFGTPPPVLPTELLYKFLLDGGTTDLSVDGTTPVKYRYTVPADKLAVIQRSLAMVNDKGIVPSKFGAIDALTNGLLVEAIDTNGSTIMIDFMDGEPIKDNSDFSHFAIVDIKTDAGMGDDLVLMDWLLPTPLILTAGQIFQVTVRDDLTDISHIHWSIQGMILDATKSA